MARSLPQPGDTWFVDSSGGMSRNDPWSQRNPVSMMQTADGAVLRDVKASIFGPGDRDWPEDLPRQVGFFFEKIVGGQGELLCVGGQEMI